MGLLGDWDSDLTRLSHSALMRPLLGWFPPTILAVPLQRLASHSLTQEIAHENASCSVFVFVLDYHVPFNVIAPPIPHR